MSPSSARLPRPSPALAAVALLLAATFATVAEARVQVRPVESTVVLDGFRPSDFADPAVQRDFCAAFTASIDLDERYCEILSAYRPCASCSGVAVRFVVYIPEWIPGGWWYAYDRLIVVVRYDVRNTLIRYNPIFNVVAKVNVNVNVGGDKDSWKNSEKDIDEPPAVDDASRVVAPVEESPPEGEPVVSPTDEAGEDRGAPATDEGTDLETDVETDLETPPETGPETEPEGSPTERDTPDDEIAVDESQTREDRAGERDAADTGVEPDSPDPGQTGKEDSADSDSGGFDFANERETRESNPSEEGPGTFDDVGEGFDSSDRGGGAFDNRGEATTGADGGGRENRDFDFSGGSGGGGGFGGDAEVFPVGGGDGGGGGGGLGLGGGDRGGGGGGGRGGGGGGRRGGGRRGGDK